MGKLSSWLLLILIAAVLISTNPTKEQYAEWAAGQLSQTAQDEQNSIESLIIGWGMRTFAPGVIRDSTSEHNYYLFSLYNTRVGEQRFTAIGILSHFVFIESANEAAVSRLKPGAAHDSSPPYLQFIYEQLGR
ncbi:MAG: DUF4359 domain-containing protein [Syntrophomonadaceae bacterium]|jgi:hypothetical protein|nr:DUF4359 domain-containing protein [Syntrophomonadaceae bacterium]